MDVRSNEEKNEAVDLVGALADVDVDSGIGDLEFGGVYSGGSEGRRLETMDNVLVGTGKEDDEPGALNNA